jgi:hypothetical protein
MQALRAGHVDSRGLREVAPCSSRPANAALSNAANDLLDTQQLRIAATARASAVRSYCHLEEARRRPSSRAISRE